MVIKLVLTIAITGAYLKTTSFLEFVPYYPPVHTIIISFATCALLLLGLGRNFPELFTTFENDDVLPVNTKSQNSAPSTACKRNVKDSSSRGSLVLLLLAASMLTARVELYRRLNRIPQCNVNSLEVFLPLSIAFADVGVRVALKWWNGKLLKVLTLEHLRFLPSAFLLSLGCWLLLALRDTTISTYICPLSGGPYSTQNWLGHAAGSLDTVLVYTAYELSTRRIQASLPTCLRGTNTWASILIVTTTIWLALGIIIRLAVSDDFRERLPFDVIFSVAFARWQFMQALSLSLLYITALVSSSHYGIIYTSMSGTAIAALVPSWQFIWNHHVPFPLVSPGAAIASFTLVCLGWRTFEFSRHHLHLEKQLSLRRHVVLLLVFLLVATYPCWSSSTIVRNHPIDSLIEKANRQHEIYKQRIRAGNSLQDAVVEYKQRYKMRPPPGFNIWYEYAMSTSTTVIDDFDQIHDDLLPFRMVSPADLRRQTWEMVSDPENWIAGISIRNGSTRIQDNMQPTHKWMIEGVEVLIKSFARHLPDMDLAFNLNDESRVAVPHAEISLLLEQARNVRLLGSGSWSSNRSESWRSITESSDVESVFVEASHLNSFEKYGSIACDPGSPARRTKLSRSPSSHLCLDCIKPHSEGHQFVSDWSLAADVCHQPDLAHLHGFYLSPAAFRTSNKLMPVFSQSKPHGFHDILYPSAWNYRDKVKYEPAEDPDFALKENTLFWRGATSEGVSRGDHAWHGMTRQRLVHMTNNLTHPDHKGATILLPSGQHYQYSLVSAASIPNLGLNTNISFVNKVDRCGGIDCDQQYSEFTFNRATDFQEHWKYRYLFDLDGAGFSGRFLPFLQSKSLPFKSALFREWYDSRLTAWKHFVPQDIRLHALWSTLAYFAGVQSASVPGELVGGKLDGKVVKGRVGVHMVEGERIATDGREWADKVLRKEDMELYFWRLLLEWGRLTDDNRDELGFSI